MTNPNDRAFPSSGDQFGKTIRESFAESAMIGIMASPRWNGKPAGFDAVLAADELIAALNAPVEPTATEVSEPVRRLREWLDRQSEELDIHPVFPSIELGAGVRIVLTLGDLRKIAEERP